MDAQDDKYELKGPDADAKGVFTDKGFLVEAGSTARREVTASGKHVEGHANGAHREAI